MASLVRLRRSGLEVPIISIANATFSSTVRHGNVESSWNTTPILGSGPVTGLPATLTVPVVAFCSPATTASSVDLPQPLGPTIETKLECGTIWSMSVTAVTRRAAVSNTTDSPVISMPCGSKTLPLVGGLCAG